MAGPVQRPVRLGLDATKGNDVNEQEIAMREGAQNAAEAAYFDHRPQVDTLDRRRVFNAGFQRGWEAAAPRHPFGIPDERIKAIAESMPGGLDGFLKGWGWLQFARAIEQEQGIDADA